MPRAQRPALARAVILADGRCKATFADGAGVLVLSRDARAFCVWTAPAPTPAPAAGPAAAAAAEIHVTALALRRHRPLLAQALAVRNAHPPPPESGPLAAAAAAGGAKEAVAPWRQFAPAWLSGGGGGAGDGEAGTTRQGEATAAEFKAELIGSCLGSSTGDNSDSSYGGGSRAWWLDPGAELPPPAAGPPAAFLWTPRAMLRLLPPPPPRPSTGRSGGAGATHAPDPGFEAEAWVDPAAEDEGRGRDADPFVGGGAAAAAAAAEASAGNGAAGGAAAERRGGGARRGAGPYVLTTCLGGRFFELRTPLSGGGEQAGGSDGSRASPSPPPPPSPSPSPSPASPGASADLSSSRLPGAVVRGVRIRIYASLALPDRFKGVAMRLLQMRSAAAGFADASAAAAAAAALAAARAGAPQPPGPSAASDSSSSSSSSTIATVPGLGQFSRCGALVRAALEDGTLVHLSGGQARVTLADGRLCAVPKGRGGEAAGTAAAAAAAFFGSSSNSGIGGGGGGGGSDKAPTLSTPATVSAAVALAEDFAAWASGGGAEHERRREGARVRAAVEASARAAARTADAFATGGRRRGQEGEEDDALMAGVDMRGAAQRTLRLNSDALCERGRGERAEV